MRLPILEKLLPGKKHVGVIRDSVSDIHDDPTIRLASKTIERIRESPRIMRMRSLLKQEFGYPEEEFDRIWVSYTLSLRTFGGKNRDWNSDIEDMLRRLGVPEADIVLARTDLPMPVFHRILLRIRLEREDFRLHERGRN